MIDPSIRIRRAIHLNDLSLLQRIIKKNPNLVQNINFADNGNTSLHLAAQLGHLEIAVRVTTPHRSFGENRDMKLLIQLIFSLWLRISSIVY